MGLSKRRRTRNSTAKIKLETPSSLVFAQRFLAANRWTLHTVDRTIRQAVHQRIWLQDMQTQLENTTRSLKQNPSSVIRSFQTLLSGPSYFQPISNSGNWILLLGPSAKQRTLMPMLAPAAKLAPLRVFDFVAVQPTVAARMLRRARRYGRVVMSWAGSFLRVATRWLMHPVLDTREPSEPIS